MTDSQQFFEVKYPKGTTEHPLNKSGKRKILVSVWDFGATHPQSERSYYLCNDHPAKMRPSLARAILQLYGESPVLDPMAGIGTTLVEAKLLGMNAIGVEYENRFVNQANENIKHLQKIHGDKNLGKAVCIQGDARDLSCLKNVNTVLFSPPYFIALKKGDGRLQFFMKKQLRNCRSREADLSLSRRTCQRHTHPRKKISVTSSTFIRCLSIKHRNMED